MSQKTDNNKSEKEFDYGGGELVFNGIIRTDVHRDNPEQLRDQILDNLSEFTPGVPGSEGSGRIDLDLESHAEANNLPSELKEIASNLLSIEYRYEHYPNETIEVVEYDDDGEATHTEAFPRKTHSVFAYWDYPGTIFVQGAKTRVEEVAPKINSSLGEDVSFNYHEFDEEFLLWLVIRDKHSLDLNTRLDIVELSASEITGGNPEDFGRDAEVDNSDDIGQSLPIQAGILKDMDFSMLEGDFSINGYRVNSKIYSDGRVRLYANRDLGEVSKLERALISLLFLSELIDEYEQWSNLSVDEKYPHPRYFKELHDEANKQGANYDFDFTSLVHRYADLRDENPSDYEFEFEIYEPEDNNE